MRLIEDAMDYGRHDKAMPMLMVINSTEDEALRD